MFISPPSLAVLRSRLVGRGTETEEAVKARLDTALKEIDYAKSGPVMDLVIVNDDLERAYGFLEKVALGETDVEGDKLPEFSD